MRRQTNEQTKLPGKQVNSKYLVYGTLLAPGYEERHVCYEYGKKGLFTNGENGLLKHYLFSLGALAVGGKQKAEDCYIDHSSL